MSSLIITVVVGLIIAGVIRRWMFDAEIKAELKAQEIQNWSSWNREQRDAMYNALVGRERK